MPLFNREKKKNIIGLEDAEKQVAIFVDYYDLEIGEEGTNPDHQENIEAALKKLVRHVMAGRLEIELDENDKIQITQHIKKGDGDMKTLKYRVLNGQAKKEMKNAKDGDFHGKMYAMVGSLAGTSGNGIANLTGSDLSVCECLGALFLVV